MDTLNRRLGSLIAKILSLVSILLAISTLSVSASNNKYVWSKNSLVDAPADRHIQVEASLAVDAQQRVWLTFLDADYHEIANRFPKSLASRLPKSSWIAWPRVLRLFQSVDGGFSFKAQPDLEPTSGAESLATTTSGDTVCAYIQHVSTAHERLALKNLSSFDQAPLRLESGADPTDVDIGAGRDGVVNLVSNARSYGKVSTLPVIFSRSSASGKSWISTQRLPSVGIHPVTAETAETLFVVGTKGFCRSEDRGVTFSPVTVHSFGNKLVSVSSNLNRSELYVVGDAVKEGLYLQCTRDGGATWTKTRIDTAKKAQAWRYPAVYADSTERLHVVWMDDRTGYGALYHAYSDNGGKSFSKNSCISDEQFPFPVDAPWPPPADQSGNWVGNRLGLTSCADNVIVAWSDQRSGHTKSKVYVSVGTNKRKHKPRKIDTEKH